jgi:hypothetical protein
MLYVENPENGGKDANYEVKRHEHANCSCGVGIFRQEKRRM